MYPNKRYIKSASLWRNLSVVAAVAVCAFSLAGCPANNPPGPKNPPLVPTPKA